MNASLLPQPEKEPAVYQINILGDALGGAVILLSVKEGIHQATLAFTTDAAKRIAELLKLAIAHVDDRGAEDAAKCSWNWSDGYRVRVVPAIDAEAPAQFYLISDWEHGSTTIMVPDFVSGPDGKPVPTAQRIADGLIAAAEQAGRRVQLAGADALREFQA